MEFRPYVVKASGASRGSSLIKSKTTLIVKKQTSGDILYSNTFDTKDIIGYDTYLKSDTNSDGTIKPSENTIKYKEELINQKFHIFFDDDHFLKPALGSKIAFDPDIDFPEEPIWRLIQADNTAICFYYNINDESVIKIVYIKKYNGKAGLKNQVRPGPIEHRFRKLSKPLNNA